MGITQSSRVLARSAPLSLRRTCVSSGARLALISASALHGEGVLARTTSLPLGGWLGRLTTIFLLLLLGFALEHGRRESECSSGDEERDRSAHLWGPSPLARSLRRGPSGSCGGLSGESLLVLAAGRAAALAFGGRVGLGA